MEEIALSVLPQYTESEDGSEVSEDGSEVFEDGGEKDNQDFLEQLSRSPGDNQQQQQLREDSKQLGCELPPLSTGDEAIVPHLADQCQPLDCICGSTVIEGDRIMCQTCHSWQHQVCYYGDDYPKGSHVCNNCASHSSEASLLKPYRCQFPGCTQSYRSSSERSRHHQVRHGVAAKGSPLFCSDPGCPFQYPHNRFNGFRRRDHWRAHMKRAHQCNDNNMGNPVNSKGDLVLARQRVIKGHRD